MIKKADLRIARRFFTGEELNWIQDTETERDERFFYLWTKKEAALKRLGRGISHIRSVDVLSGELAGLLFTMRVKDYSISVCSTESFDMGCLVNLSEADIIDMWKEQKA